MPVLFSNTRYSVLHPLIFFPVLNVSVQGFQSKLPDTPCQTPAGLPLNTNSPWFRIITNAPTPFLPFVTMFSPLTRNEIVYSVSGDSLIPWCAIVYCSRLLLVSAMALFSTFIVP